MHSSIRKLFTEDTNLSCSFYTVFPLVFKLYHSVCYICAYMQVQILFHKKWLHVYYVHMHSLGVLYVISKCGA